MTNFIKTSLTCLFLTFFISSIYSQKHHHVHLNNEIGIGVGAIRSFEHDEWGTGMHIHYFRAIKPHSKWFIGTGLEYVKSDDNHMSIEVGLNYLLLDRLSIGIMPGITFLEKKSEEHPQKTFMGVHFELIYGLLHFEKFHLGPVLDYSLSKYDKHFALGIHAGYCF